MTNDESRADAHPLCRAPALAWLTAHTDIGVRLVCAPPGFGKTTLLQAYAAENTDRRRLFLTCGPATRATAFRESIARITTRPLEVLVDDVHLAAGELLSAINGLLAEPPAGVSFILASQRRDIFDIERLCARGRVAVCDQAKLALDANDTQAACIAQRVAATPAEIADLVARTAGWPLAIAGTLGEAARESQPIDRAFATWQRGWAETVPGLITTLLERLPFTERAATHRHFFEGAPLDAPTLAVLHRCGFFVRLGDGALRLMDWVDELYPATRKPRGPEIGRAVMTVQLFGRFTAHIGGVQIIWARRRDAQIVKYLLLRPQGATRTELADIFWPDMPRPLAMQNLRTACSTIRRAVGNVVGIEHVGAYLHVGDRLKLNAEAIVCDVDAFRAHVASADSATGSGESIAHLRAAARLYGNGLFAGDFSEPVFCTDAEQLGAIYARVLRRLSGALIESGAPELAREYATKSVDLVRSQRSDTSGTHVHVRVAVS